MSTPPTTVERDEAVIAVLAVDGEAPTYRVSMRASDLGLTHTAGMRMAHHLASMRRRGLVTSTRSGRPVSTVYWMLS